MSWLEPFRDSVVLVTGASSGIGRATALAFAHGGAHVAVAARRESLLDELAAQAGRDVPGVPTAAPPPGQAAACIDAVAQRFGRLDVVVNNAGVLIPGRLDEMVEGDLDTMLRVNLFGQLFVMQEALRVMGPRRDGVIVNVASLAGRRGTRRSVATVPRSSRSSGSRRPCARSLRSAISTWPSCCPASSRPRWSSR